MALGFVVGYQDHQARELTAREVVEAIAEFDVRHVDQQPFFKSAYGATNFELSPPAIYIFNAADLTSRESTVIHELLHVRCRKAVVKCTEDWVAAEEDRQFKLLFGEKP